MIASQPYALVRFIRELVNMVAGLLIWALHLAFVYSMHTIACARGAAGWTVLGFGLVPFTVTVASALALAGSAVVLAIALRDLRQMRGEGDDVRDSQRFMTYTSATVAGFSMLAIAWVGLPALFIDPCSGY
jgi:hypothetical protein